MQLIQKCLCTFPLCTQLCSRHCGEKQDSGNMVSPWCYLTAACLSSSNKHLSSWFSVLQPHISPFWSLQQPFSRPQNFPILFPVAEWLPCPFLSPLTTFLPYHHSSPRSQHKCHTEKLYPIPKTRKGHALWFYGFISSFISSYRS